MAEHDDPIIWEDRRAALYRAIALLRDADECRDFLADLCTPREINDCAERWLLARLLDRGAMSYRDISAVTGASTTTVGRVARFLQHETHKGYRRILDRIAGM